MARTHRSALGFLALVSAAGLALVGCGAAEGAPTDETTAAGDTQSVTVEAGFIPVMDLAALYLGDEVGIFEEHGIDLSINVGASGSALVPSVVSGEYQFAFSNLVSLLQARDQGLPVQIIGAGSSSTGEVGADVTMIHAAPASGIESAADLEGKTVSVNARNSLLEMLGKIAVESDGGDPDKVDFIELGFADALAALEGGSIDAMVGAEPFGTAAIEAGFPAISSPYAEMSDSSMLTSAYYSTQDQIDADPELFENIRLAITESLEYAQEHPDDIRAQLVNVANLDEAVADSVILPSFSPEIPEESITLFSKYAKQFGMTNAEISYDDIVWSAAR